jgi:hypothetical protein
MISAEFARELVRFLWSNQHVLAEQVDPESMPLDKLDVLVKQNVLVRPFRIATSLARQGYFVSAWSLFEFYAHGLCACLSVRVKRRSNELSVDWVNRSFLANGKEFRDYGWFAAANCLRNLIAHCCGRVINPRGEGNFKRAQQAFPDLQLYKDDFILFKHEHIAELQVKIEDFIEDTSSFAFDPDAI